MEKMNDSNITTDNEITNGWKKKYFIVASGQAISIIGSGAVQFSLIWWLTSESRSPMILALAGLSNYLPQAILGPFAGVWIDRLKRKTVMICSDMFTGIMAALLAFCFFAGTPPYWVACIILGIRSIGNVFQTPATQAMLPLLVPANELVRVNSINQFIQTGGSFLGPMIGAAMFSALPMHLILLTDLVGAIIACATVAVVKIPELKHQATAKVHFFEELKEGAKCFTLNKHLQSYTIILFICTLFYMPLGVFVPLMVSEIFSGGEWHAGLAQVFSAIGVFAAVGLMGVIGDKLKNKLNVSQIGLLIFAVALFISGILPHNIIGLWIFIFVCLFMGAGVNICNIPYISYIQQTLPNEAQGRVLSLYYSLVSIAMPIGLLFAGPVSQVLGLTPLFIIAGTGILCALLLGRIINRA
jgi:DHA3 family macrolide efflux protein-like MFS transporter